MPPELLGKLCMSLAMVPTQPSFGRGKQPMAATHYTIGEDQHGRALLAGPENLRASPAGFGEVQEMEGTGSSPGRTNSHTPDAKRELCNARAIQAEYC